MPENLPSPMPRRALIMGTLALAIVDILSKYIIFAVIDRPAFGTAHGTPVIEGFFYLTLRDNTGFSWSSFSGIPWLLSAFINLLILGVVIYLIFFTRRIPANRWNAAAGMLIMSGALGNLYDRIVHHAVRDFIDIIIPIINYDYPVFNIADVFIVAGVIIALLEPYLSRRVKKEAASG